MPFSAGFWLFLSHGGVVGGCLHVAAEPVCFLLGCRRSKGRSFYLLSAEQQPGRVSSLCISSSSQGAVHSGDFCYQMHPRCPHVVIYPRQRGGVQDMPNAEGGQGEKNKHHKQLLVAVSGSLFLLLL